MPHLLSTDLQLWVNTGRGTWPTIQEIILKSQRDEVNILPGHESESTDEDHEVEYEMQMDSEGEQHDDIYDDDYDMYGGYESPWLYDSDELEEIICSFR